MRLSAIGSPNANRSKYNSNIKNNQKNAQSFKGGMGLVNFWQWVDNGGRALQFTIEDMFGTNIPRTYKGAMAGYKYTGKVNVPALLQEAIREFLTGPTMCVVPIVVLNAAMKSSGKTANTHVENIENLSYLMSKTKSGDAKDFEKRFYTTCVEDMLKQTTNQDAIKKEHVESLVSQIQELGNSTDKKKTAGILASLQENFEGITKKLMDEETFKKADFTAAKYSISETKTGSANFKNYVEYMSNFAKDYSKKYSKEASDGISKININSFKNTWIGKRVAVIASMFALTGVCMSIIPKIYTLASGSRNPNASAIYDEAEGKNVKVQKKGGK